MKPFRLSLCSICCWSWLILQFSVTSGVAEVTSLQEKVEPLVNSHAGQVAIAIKDLRSDESLLVNGDRPMPTASLIKLAVMVTAYRQADAGAVDLNRLITLREEDQVPGSGILTDHFSPGLQLSLRDAIQLMIAYSDNTATNLVLDEIGLASTANAMESLGWPNTKVHSKVYRGKTSIFPERSREFGLGSTTARETLELLEGLWNGELASEESTRKMLEHLRDCQDTSRLPKLLPPKTVIAHKTGSVSAVRTAAGIIEAPQGPLIVVVLTAENEDRSWTEQNAAENLIARITKTAYDHFHTAKSTDGLQPRQLAQGAQGWLVEALQRTLNHRLSPSPELSVDGDFGPVTEEAVRTFQASQKLKETGVVDGKTWEALGPLLTSDVVITDPQTFDMSLSSLAPQDSLTGQPFVTCKAWIVGDAQTGEIVGGDDLDRRLENASTTKLMTAWIALREADKDASLLNERVVISSRAAETPGSTAKVQAGESTTLQDLLYGLLLPSGNDAAVAIAEHLGDRFAPAEPGAATEDSLECFVAEMNRTAEQLGMNNTTFANPHGLSASGHRTTVRDLFQLAKAIADDGRLLPYVQTRKHIGQLTGEAGYVRYELWTNTNRLLNIEGYAGMKTGTTRPAGACLVSLAERGGQRLIAVVLGSSSSDARYTDTRNLFRWAWTELQASDP